MIEFRIRKRKNEHVLSVKGDLTIQVAERFHQGLTRLLKKDTSLEINLEKTEQIDLAGIQLVYSAIKSLGSHKLTIKGEPDTMFSLAETAGLIQENNCLIKNDNECLWVIGGTV